MHRLLIYFCFDPQGRVDAYVEHKLRALRPHCERIFVVVNGELTDSGRERLEANADDVWVRENVGFDVWAYKEALLVVGREQVASYDEIVLMNYTFFGPVGTFAPLFERMDARSDIDFWGITEHGPVPPGKLVEDSPQLAQHLQSHWLAIRRSLAKSDDFAEYWDQMPMIESYLDSVYRHEGAFTAHFEGLGYSGAAAYPVENYATMHPVMDDAASLLEDGCPIVKRRVFFHDPLYLDTRGIDGRHILNRMEQEGYPVDLALANLARTSEPRKLMTNAGLLEVLPETDISFDRTRALRVVAVVHIYYPDLTEELIARLEFLPVDYDLVVTTTGEARADEIRSRLDALGRAAEIRLVESNRGRDVSAFVVGCADVLLDDYDLIVKLHSKRSPQDAGSAGTLFRRHLLENLLSSEGYAANVLALFQKYPSLGMVIPPVIHIAYPTLGHSWFHNLDPARVEAARLGITVPFDAHTPVATYGSMFIARPEAIRSIVSAGYTWEDFPREDGYSDGGLAHVLERLFAYAALSDGFHVREVLNAQHAATSYKLLEYKAQAVLAMLPGPALEQAPYVRMLERQVRRLRSQLSRERKRARRDLMPLELRPAPVQRAKNLARRRSPGAARVLATPYRAALNLIHRGGEDIR